jgi:hypothetical protein
MSETCNFARITEAINPKGLRAGMSKTRQDTYREGQQADDPTGKILFFSASFIQ